MDLKKLIKRNSNSAFQIADEKAVIMLAENSNIFTLSETGTVIWNILETPKTVEELLAGLYEKFTDDDKEAIKNDLMSFIHECTADKLIIVED